MNRDLLTASEQRRVDSFLDSFARRYGYPNGLPAGVDPVDAIRERVTKPARLLDLAFDGDWLCDERIGRALRAAITRDDLHAGDLLREMLTPLIDAEVDRLAKHEGVGEYFDLMAVAA